MVHKLTTAGLNISCDELREHAQLERNITSMSKRGQFPLWGREYATISPGTVHSKRPGMTVDWYM